MVARGRVTFVVAALTHAALFGAIASVKAPPHTSPPIEALELSIEPEVVVLPVPTPTAAPSATAEEGTAAASTTRFTGTRAAREEASGEAMTPPPAAPASSDAPGRWTFSPMAPSLGIGERTGALARASGALETTANDPSAAAGRALVAASDKADAERGYARGTPLREAVEETAQRGDAPTAGVAVFEITVGPTQAARARLVEASSNYAGWSALTGAIDTAARKKSIRFPPSGEGLRVVVRVSADLFLPDGRSGKELGVHTSTQGLDLRDDAGAGESKLVLPSATLALNGKVCSLRLTAGVTPTPIQGSCSPEMIGTRLSRHIRTELVTEQRISLAPR
jgi:hypothetical protein